MANHNGHAGKHEGEGMKLLDRIARNRFLVLGRVGMDLTPTPPGTRTEDATEIAASMGGSSANIAAGIVKLGGQADLVTVVSDDAVGRFCLNQLDHYGIGRRHVRALASEVRTSLAVYESRVEDHQSVIYRNNAADFQMNAEDVAAPDYSGYGALITTGTVFAAEPSRSAAFDALERARAASLPVIFDVDYRPYSWPSLKVAEDVLSRAGALSDVIVGNDEEFGFMAGGYDKGLDCARKLAAASASIVVYKMGPKGAITFADGEDIRTGIYPTTPLKPTGAGDSFMAGLVTSLAEGRGLREAVLRGSAAASIVVARVGCALAMPYPDELADYMASRQPAAFEEA